MVKVKICGFTNADDVKVACELGADMVGVILVPQSTRYVTIEQAKRIFAATSGGVAKVAVIMPRHPNELDTFVRELKPDYLQIHPTFSEDELLNAKKRLGVKLIPVVAIPQKVENYREILERAAKASEAADYLLLDTKGPSGGGTGLTHDWRLSWQIRETVNMPVFLAGDSTLPTSRKPSKRCDLTGWMSRPAWSQARAKRTRSSCANSLKRRRRYE